MNKTIDSNSLLPYHPLRIPIEINDAEIKNSLRIPEADSSFYFYIPFGYKTVEKPEKIIKGFVDTLFIFVGKMKNGDLVFAADRNFNRQFNDDSLVTVKDFFNNDTIIWLHQIQNRIKYKVFYPFSHLDIHRILTLVMDVDVYKNTNELKKSKSDTWGNVQLNLFFRDGYMYNCFRSGLSKYCIISDDLIRARFIGVPANKIYVYKHKTFRVLDKINHADGYRLQDTLKLGRSEWVFSYQSYEGDTVVFSRIGKRKIKWGYREGEYAVDFVKKDVFGNVVISDSVYKHPALFIFWGWWCTSCLVQLPDYDAFYHSTRNMHLNFIGVALDNPENIDFTMEEIERLNITWPTIISNMYSKDKTELSNLFGIDGVSTFVVTDKNRKIIYKGFDFEKVKEIIQEIAK